jgi:hypothetical protein
LPDLVSVARVRDSGHGAIFLVRSGAGFDLVAQDEIGTGVTGLGSGQVLTQLGVHPPTLAGPSREQGEFSTWGSLDAALT